MTTLGHNLQVILSYLCKFNNFNSNSFRIFTGAMPIIDKPQSPVKSDGSLRLSNPSTPTTSKSASVNKVIPSPRPPPPLQRSPSLGHSGFDHSKPPIISGVIGIKSLGSPASSCIDYIIENQKLKQQVAVLTFENVSMKKTLLEFEVKALSMHKTYIEGCSIAQRLQIQKTSIEREFYCYIV